MENKKHIVVTSHDVSLDDEYMQWLYDIKQ